MSNIIQMEKDFEKSFKIGEATTVSPTLEEGDNYYGEHLLPGHELPWPIWKSLNRLRRLVGR